MTPAEVLTHLRRDQVVLWPDSGRLCYSAPPGVMTPERLSQARACKDGLMTLLAAEAETDPAALRLAAANAKFDAEPDDEEVPMIATIEGRRGPVRCRSCGFELTQGIAVCPVCHPAPRVPTGRG